jgi:hypothetical protein
MKFGTDQKNQLWTPLPAPKKLLVVSGVLALFLLSLLAACFVVPDEQILWLDQTFKFKAWDWSSVSRVAERTGTTAQFRYQLAVLFATSMPTVVSFLLLLYLFPSAEPPIKGDAKAAVQALAILVACLLMLFAFPSIYVGGESVHFGLQSAFVAVPFLFCIGVCVFMSTSNLLLFAMDMLSKFFLRTHN